MVQKPQVSLHLWSTSSSWWHASWSVVQFKVSLPTRNKGASSLEPSAQATAEVSQTPHRTGQLFLTWPTADLQRWGATSLYRSFSKNVGQFEQRDQNYERPLFHAGLASPSWAKTVKFGVWKRHSIVQPKNSLKRCFIQSPHPKNQEGFNMSSYKLPISWISQQSRWPIIFLELSPFSGKKKNKNPRGLRAMFASRGPPALLQQLPTGRRGVDGEVPRFVQVVGGQVEGHEGGPGILEDFWTNLLLGWEKKNK